MAVSKAGLSDKEFFTSLGMLIIQGRKWDAFRRIRGRGLHCPTVRNSSPPHHQCSLNNMECQMALSFRNAIQLIWQCGGTVVIEVILLPECGHSGIVLLLEKWTLQQTKEVSTMPELSLMQAIDSTIHFSQLCSWWSSTNGTKPRHVQYKVYEQDDSNEHLDSCSTFAETALYHQFKVSQGVNVRMEYLPRQLSIPELDCGICTTSQQMNFGVLNRGRSVLHQRHVSSRRSSASSDSISPSLSSRKDRPPLAPSFRASLSPSSSSRGSSRTGSPCLSRSPSERSLSLAFEVSQRSEGERLPYESTNCGDSGFLDNTSRQQILTINQDEELANQLDSLSDSDLSDDYVIDGPVGSPRLAGTPIASPDDSRVQRLRSTFAGFHCRHPAFDRLMCDAVKTSNRTRHSSLDSAVSNLERLDLRTRRQLSRTSSDGHEFENFRENCLKESDKGFFVNDGKKQRRLLSSEEMDCSDDNNPRCISNNMFYASFRTDSNSEWEDTTGVLDFCSSDNFSSPFSNLVFPPRMISTPATVGYVAMSPIPNLPFVQDASCRKVNPEFYHCEDPPSFIAMQNFPISKRLLHCDPAYALTRSASADSMKVCSRPRGSDETLLLKTQPPKALVQKLTISTCQTPKRDASANATSPEVDIQRNLDFSNEESEESDEGKEIADSTTKGAASSVLLRSPPSKLRILPSHCIEKSYSHNPPRLSVHKISAGTQSGPARRLKFNPPSEKSVCTSPALIRRDNAVRFEFDEDMPKLNQRSSRSTCRGKCMKKNGVVSRCHTHQAPTRRLLGSFEECIIHNCLEVLGSVDGFHAQLGASGSFCPTKVKLPVPVRFFHVSDDNAPSPYMGTMSLKGRECGKRGYHIPRKGTIQLTLFNPNNSVVKVFVILYDVSDMPPGHRTFLRHRIFSKLTAAPEQSSENASYNADMEQPATHESMPKAKFLRYFVHFWLESSKTNKVYIHGDVKILFSLVSSEWDSGNTYHLKTETEYPKNPKYSSKC